MRRAALLPVATGMPVLLVLANTLLVMTPLWLTFAYSRPGFPPDRYGFSTARRTELAIAVTGWLRNAEGLDSLASLQFADGSGLFGARELAHMHDVKVLAGRAYRLAGGLLLLFLAGAWIGRRGDALRLALRRGSRITLALLAAIVALAIASWDSAFAGFHSLFFADGTWYFAYSDVLIRLFPEQFWFDAVLFVGGLTATQALLVLWLTSRGEDVWRSLKRLLYWRRAPAGERTA